MLVSKDDNHSVLAYEEDNVLLQSLPVTVLPFGCTNDVYVDASSSFQSTNEDQFGKDFFSTSAKRPWNTLQLLYIFLYHSNFVVFI